MITTQTKLSKEHQAYSYDYYYDYAGSATAGDSTEPLTLFGIDPDSLKERAGIDFYPEPYCSLVDTALSKEVCFERNILELWGGVGQEDGSSIWADSAAFWRMTPESILVKVNGKAGGRSGVYNHDHDFTRYCQSYMIFN